MGGYVLPFVAAFAAGVVNALAGGGTFLTFPALIAAGLPPVTANATSTLALYPGYFVSAYASRDGFRTVAGQPELGLTRLALISLVGGFVGALLLLYTPARVFSALVPWLLGFATLVFTLGNFLPKPTGKPMLGPAAIAGLQVPISVYGGYFGGGVGILMLAAMTLYGSRDIRLMNVVKLILVGLSNTAAVLTFVVAGSVSWPQALVMMVAAILGGFAGGKLAGVIDARIIKGFIIVVGVVLTAAFAMKG